MERNRIETPKWVEKETQRLGQQLEDEYGPDTIISDEEYDKWMWNHMSFRLKRYAKRVRKIKETER